MAIEAHEFEQQPAPYMPTKAGSEDWGTPRELVDVVARIFDGTIDLDPCGNPHSVVGAREQIWLPRWVAARRACGGEVPANVVECDGLVHPWRGNVYVNPPYSAAPLGAFMERSAANAAARDGDVIMLAPSKTSLKAWHRSVPRSAAVCFLDGRVSFLLPGGGEESATFSSALILWTEDRELAHRFAWYLDGKHGHVMWSR
jgi:hypothetical protein